MKVIVHKHSKLNARIAAAYQSHVTSAVRGVLTSTRDQTGSRRGVRIIGIVSVAKTVKPADDYSLNTSERLDCEIASLEARQPPKPEKYQPLTEAECEAKLATIDDEFNTFIARERATLAARRAVMAKRG